jgi:hypothetical protein
MASLSNRQANPLSTSGRATVGHLGQAQQLQPTPLSGRALVGQLGVGRRYTGMQDLLSPRQLHLSTPPHVLDFERLHADAERLQQKLAASRPSPLLSTAEQAHQQHLHEQLQKRVLAEYNRAAQGVFMPSFLRRAIKNPLVNLAAKPTGNLPNSPDSFMPSSFWKSQNPTGSKKVGWALCCATVYTMMETVNGEGTKPTHRYDLVTEHQGITWQKGYRVHDAYVAAPDSRRATQGLAKLESYMAAKKPVMVGVSHTLGLLFSSKDKQGTTHYRTINDGTIDHFVAIVGMGSDGKGKYYRFFDVGTTDRGKARGTSPLNRLYYNPATGFYEGTSQATGKKYVLTQLRF